ELRLGDQPLVDQDAAEAARVARRRRRRDGGPVQLLLHGRRVPRSTVPRGPAYTWAGWRANLAPGARVPRPKVVRELRPRTRAGAPAKRGTLAPSEPARTNVREAKRGARGGR